MSDLDDVKRRLYTPGGVKEPQPEFFDKSQKKVEEVKRAWGDISETEKKEAPMIMKKKRRWRVGLIALGLFLLGALAILGIFFVGFQKDTLTVSLLTKDRVESGERVMYQVLYKNTGSQTLKDIELNFTYPAGAIPLKEDRGQVGAYRTQLALADLLSGEEAKVDLEARLYGKQDEVKSAAADFLYRLENSSSRFGAKATAASTIVRVPLVLTVNLLAEAVSKQKVDLVIDYSSNAESSFENMSLGVQYPQGFQFASADPAPVIGDSIWTIGTIQPGDTGKITIRGTVIGPPADVKVFSLQMGVYNANTREWTSYQVASANTKISTPLLSIEQTINDGRDAIVKPGDTIRVRLHYKNILDIALKNVKVEATLSGQAVDLQTLRIQNGAYDATKGVIVWNPASFPTFAALPALASGDLNFQVQLKPNTSPDVTNGKNLTIESRARISSPDRPAGLEGVDLSAEDEIAAKLATRVAFSSRMLYQNPYLPNSGPLPPAVGKKTTYVVAWQIANTLNDLVNVEVHATLLPGVSWEGLFVPKEQSVTYDAGAGAVIWRIGTLGAGAGFSRNGPGFTFKIGFTPGIDQVGNSPTLVRDIQLSGIDTFTGEQVLVKVGELTTRLESDTLTKDSDWRVVK